MKNKNDKLVLEAVKCREIIKEILDFGVSQGQILTLIKFLALELEDREAMVSIRSAIEAQLDSVEKLDNNKNIII